MSYCVNCGVELDKSADKCVLCGTEVIKPKNADASVQEKPPYPDRLMIPKKVRKQYLGFLLTVILVIPNIVCVVTNLLLPESGVWSLYVVASSLLVWTWAIIPLFIQKINPYALIALDTIVALVYAFVFYSSFKEKGWFFDLAVPFILTLSLFCFVFTVWVRRKKREALQGTIIILADISLFSLIAEGLINRFYSHERLFLISIIISASCVALMLFFRATVKNERFKAWLTRRFFI